jgi:hypothetical protein
MNAAAPTLPSFTLSNNAEQNIDMLQQLIEFGMQIARTAAQQALEYMKAPQPAPEPAAKSRSKDPHPALLFLKIWGSIRQAMSMQQRLAAGADIRAKPAEAAKPGPAEPARFRKVTDPAEIKRLEEKLAQQSRDLAERLKAQVTLTTPHPA